MRKAVALLALVLSVPLTAADWTDLEETRPLQAEDLMQLLPIGFQTGRDSFRFHFLYVARFQDEKNMRSQAFLPFVYRAQSKIDSRRRSLFAPLYYTETGVDSRTVATPLVFSFSQKNGLAARRLLVTPLFGSYYSGRGLDEDLAYSSTFWAPIVPLVFHSADTTKSRTFALLADWSRSESGLERFWIYPFFGWKRGSYALLAPVFFHTEDSVQGTSSTYSPVFYRYSSAERRTVWAGPYFDSSSRESSATVLFPLYAAYDRGETSVSMIVPWKLEVKTSDFDLYIHITGLSSTSTRIAIGESNNVCLDGSVSWMYNAFSFSTRVPLSGPGKNDPASYMKVSGLYGLTAYRAEGTKRHFRLLPLSWLSWDTAGDDSTIVIPAGFAWAKSSDSSYLAVFPGLVPLYGRQETRHSLTEAVLGGLFMREQDSAKQSSEYTVLWPLVNIYESPEASGFRALPFVWRWSRREGEVTTSRMISTLYITQSVESPEATEEFNAILPVYFETTHTEKNGEREMHGNLLGLIDFRSGKGSRFWVLPVFYASPDYNALLPLYYYSKHEEKSVFVSPVALAMNDETSTTVLSPLYLNFASDGESREFGVFGAGWFRYENAETGEDLRLAGLGIVYMSSKRENRTYEGSLFGILWSREEDVETGDSRFALLEGVYARSVENGEVTHSLFGLTI